MSTAVTVLIIAIVVIAIVVVIALVRRSKKQQHQKPHMGLPDLGALSTDGLDKQHASAPREQPPSNRSTTDTAPPERRA